MANNTLQDISLIIDKAIKHIEKHFTIEKENIDKTHDSLIDHSFEHYKPYYSVFVKVFGSDKPSFINDFLPLYHLDVRVRQIIYGVIDEIEISLRTRFCYFISSKYGEYSIWKKELFSSEEYKLKYNKGIKHILSRFEYEYKKESKTINVNELKQSINNFKALEQSQLSNLIFMILSMSEEDIQDFIDNLYPNVKSVSDFKNWLLAFLSLRNKTAHFNKIIDEPNSFSIDVSKYKFIDDDESINIKNIGIFNFLLVTRLLLSKQDYFSILRRLEIVLVPMEKYMTFYGFPNNYKDLLTSD